MTTNDTAHSVDLTPAGSHCPWPKAQDVGRLAPPAWPSATCSLMDAAHQALISECARHAELTRKHAEQVKAYLDLISNGAWATSVPAQDRMFDIVNLEQHLRAIEERLIGRGHDDGC